MFPGFKTKACCFELLSSLLLAANLTVRKMRKGQWATRCLFRVSHRGSSMVCTLVWKKTSHQEVSKGRAGEGAVTPHLYLQFSMAFSELECICQSTVILLKYRLWVCRSGLGSVTLHFSEPYWSCWRCLYTDSILRSKDLGDMPAGRQSDLPHLADMFIFSIFPCMLLSRQDLKVTVL